MEDIMDKILDRTKWIGWIPIPRNLLNSPLWPIDRQLTDFEFYFYLYCRANHSTKTKYWNSQIITIKKGQVVTSLEKLHEVTNGWSKKKIRKRIEDFENMGLIKHERQFRKFTMLTICNYHNFDPNFPVKNQKEISGGTSRETQSNNDNNEFNEKERDELDEDQFISMDYKSKIRYLSDYFLDKFGFSTTDSICGRILQEARGNIEEALLAIDRVTTEEEGYKWSEGDENEIMANLVTILRYD